MVAGFFVRSPTYSQWSDPEYALRISHFTCVSQHIKTRMCIASYVAICVESDPEMICSMRDAKWERSVILKWFAQCEMRNEKGHPEYTNCPAHILILAPIRFFKKTFRLTVESDTTGSIIKHVVSYECDPPPPALSSPRPCYGGRSVLSVWAALEVRQAVLYSEYSSTPEYNPASPPTQVHISSTPASPHSYECDPPPPALSLPRPRHGGRPVLGVSDTRGTSIRTVLGHTKFQ